MLCDATLRAEIKKREFPSSFLLLPYLFLLAFYLSSLSVLSVLSL